MIAIQVPANVIEWCQRLKGVIYSFYEFDIQKSLGRGGENKKTILELYQVL